MRRVVLLVCGEPMRGDDGVAQAVLDVLSPETRRLTDVREVGQLMPDDLCDVGDAPVVLLDAVDGIAAGAAGRRALDRAERRLRPWSQPFLQPCAADSA